MQNSHNDNVRSSAVGKQLKQKSNFLSIAQHHLPTLDLFWAGDDDELMLNVLRCQLTYRGQVVTNAEARFNKSLRPRKPEGSLGRTAQDVHLDSHTAPELWRSVPGWLLLSCCLTSTEARWPIRDGDRVGRGRESDRLDRGNRPKKTGETVDRRQNNGSVKAVSPRHCPATCALRNCSFNCCAGQSH